MKHILGVYINDRVKDVGTIQKIFTEYGHIIKTRLGLHETINNNIHGLIILELTGSEKDGTDLINKLKKLAHVEIKEMKFNE